MKKLFFFFLSLAALPVFGQKIIYGPETFDSLKVGDSPSGWVYVAGAGKVATPLAITTYGASSAPNAFGISSAPNDDEAIWTTTAAKDGEVLFTQRINKNAQGAGASAGLVFNSDAAGQNQIAMVVNFLGTGNAGTSIAVSTYKRTAGSFATLSDAAIDPFSFSDGDFVTIRAQLKEGTFNFRIWKTNTAEPPTWTYTVANPAFGLASGYCGFYLSGSNAPLAAGEQGSVDDVTITDVTPAPPPTSSPIPVTTSSWYFSPYSTYSNGTGVPQQNNILAGSTRAIWTTPGSYFKVGFTGTSFTLDVDESNMTSGADAVLIWSVDDQPWQTYTLQPPGESLLQIASGLPATNHTFVLYLKASDFSADRWTNNPPTQAFQITGIQLDQGAELIPPFGPIAQRPRNLMFLGDSITEGHHTLASGAITISSDSTQVWTHGVALGLNAEYGNLGHGGLGWLSGASDGTPPLGQSFSSYFNGHSRVFGGKFAPIPDAIFVNLGTIDGNADTTSTIQTFLTAVRGDVNANTPVYMIIPFGQFQLSNIEAAVRAVNDPYVSVINLGLQASYGLTALTNVATLQSFDGLHPSAQTDAWIGASVVEQINRMRTRSILTIPVP